MPLDKKRVGPIRPNYRFFPSDVNNSFKRRSPTIGEQSVEVIQNGINFEDEVNLRLHYLLIIRLE